MHKKEDVLTFLILGSILDDISGPEDKFFCPVFVFRRGNSNHGL